MPRGDKKGPMGQGPMTGRGLGFCAGYDSPGFSKGYGGGRGRGRGPGFGAGFGRRSRFGYGWETGDEYLEGRSFAGQKNEIDRLKSEADYLKSRQLEIEQRIKELETNNTK